MICGYRMVASQTQPPQSKPPPRRATEGHDVTGCGNSTFFAVLDGMRARFNRVAPYAWARRFSRAASRRRFPYGAEAFAHVSVPARFLGSRLPWRKCYAKAPR
jgi:hypothetical protein